MRSPSLCQVVSTFGSPVAGLIRNAPTLSYSGEAPEKHRERIGQIKDELDDGTDGLADREESESEEGLSLVAQLVVLFKTMEILGQILKNQYARIERPRKVELITEIFCGPLRALNDFYESLERAPDYLVAEIDAELQKRGKLEDKEERIRLAKQIVGHIIQAITFSFIQKAGSAVSGETLAIDVKDAVEKNGSIAFRLIESFLALDSPKPLGKEALSKLKDDVKNDVVSYRVLYYEVLHHLYMFKTTEADKQWLSSDRGLGFNLEAQHALEFNTRGTKKQ